MRFAKLIAGLGYQTGDWSPWQGAGNHTAWRSGFVGAAGSIRDILINVPIYVRTKVAPQNWTFYRRAWNFSLRYC